MELTGRPLIVRGYFAISSRLPVFQRGLFGRGMIAVSEAGRSRFGQFPEMVADDLFLDSQFTDVEKCQVEDVATVVETPLTTKDLVRRLVRVRRGNTAMRAAGRAGDVGAPIREADRWSWLRDVVVPQPKLAPAGLAYLAITIWAALLARRDPKHGNVWGRTTPPEPEQSPAAPKEASVADRLLNICFHGIGTPGRALEPGEDRYWITSDEFHRILDEIATWPSTRISFDDGNASDLEIGLPALVERGLTATSSSSPVGSVPAAVSANRMSWNSTTGE